MDQSNEDKRKFDRFMLPVVIEAPNISDLPIIPEDVSVGGFKIMLVEKHQEGTRVDCSIQLSGKSFDNCQAHIAWLRENSDPPGTWFAGFELETLDGKQGEFESLLRKSNENLM